MDEPRCADWLVTHRAFYADFEALPQRSDIVDHFYVMKDCGVMTGDQCAFASPLVEIAFLFRSAPDGSESIPKIVVVEPAKCWAKSAEMKRAYCSCWMRPNMSG